MKYTRNICRDACKLEVDMPFHTGVWEYDLAEQTLYWLKDCSLLIENCGQARIISFGDFLRHVHPEDRARVEYFNHAAVGLKEGVFIQYEYRLITNDGSMRWVREEAGPLYGTEGRPEKVIGLMIDITDYKSDLPRLKGSEQYLKALISQTPGVIYRYSVDDKGMQLTYLDGNVKQLLGFDPIDFKNNPALWFSCLHPSDLALIREAGKRILQEKNLRIEYRFRDKAGCYHWLQDVQRLFKVGTATYEVIGIWWDITPRKQSEKTLERAQADLEKRVEERTAELRNTNEKLCREVAERKKAEKALAKEKEFLQVILQSIGDGVIITDTEGCIRMANPAARQITGFNPAELTGKPLVEMLSFVTGNGKAGPCQDALGLILGKKDYGSGKHEILIAANGSRKLVTPCATGIRDATRELIGYIVTIRDVTDAVKFEARLALSRKLESIGRLAAGVAHEINTPMQYIGDNTRFLKESFEKIAAFLPRQGEPEALEEESSVCLDPAEIDYYRKEIPLAIDETLQGIKKVNTLLVSMKNFSHPDRGEKLPADLNRALEDTVRVSRNEWKYVADVILDLDPDLPMVSCYIDGLSQVFLNLIVNASQAVEEAVESGRYTKGEIRIRSCLSGDQVMVIVEDNGDGIEKGHIGKVFDPFFTTKDIGRGSGQGLMIAYDIVTNNHGGLIEVQSDQGKGTLFKICLPCC